ncbi:MAG TPA: hypothetical protein VD947_02900 [Patescibacteria group bacterium]|nr:hypothetical protein [Patescibacteria group bacterium]
MNGLLLHSRTKASVEQIINNPLHAIGIEAEAGSGKKHLSLYIASQIIQVKNILSYPYLLTIDCNDSKIGIEDMRSAIEFLSLKIPGNKKYKRCLIIWSLEKLGLEAQNSLLKSLEEPPADTIIIVTTTAKKNLLPTTASRMSWLSVVPVDLKASMGYFSDEYDADKVIRSYNIADGKVGMMVNLLDNSGGQAFIGYIEKVKVLLRMDRFGRLQGIDALTKDKDFDLAIFLLALAKVYQSAIKGEINKGKKPSKKMLLALNKIILAQETSKYNANQKALLTDIFYNL